MRSAFSEMFANASNWCFFSKIISADLHGIVPCRNSSCQAVSADRGSSQRCALPVFHNCFCAMPQMVFCVQKCAFVVETECKGTGGGGQSGRGQGQHGRGGQATLCGAGSHAEGVVLGSPFSTAAFLVVCPHSHTAVRSGSALFSLQRLCRPMATFPDAHSPFSRPGNSVLRRCISSVCRRRRPGPRTSGSTAPNWRPG